MASPSAAPATPRIVSGIAPLFDRMEPVRLTLEAGRIAAIEPAVGITGPVIVPGFVDGHCHGGGGADVMEAGDAALRMAALHARHGTTSVLATTMTAPVEEIEAALGAVAAAMAEGNPDAATIAGVHLEGPFIAADRLGAQPAFPLAADPALMARFLSLAPIRVVTLAPEVDPERRLGRMLKERGVRVQLAHSSCDYDTAAAWLREGAADGITHLFNAMTGLQHRAPGLAGAALAHARHAEIIADLLHVHAGAMRAALRAIPHLYAITDGTAASGMPDGDYRLGRQPVRRQGDAVRLADGGLAGSCLTMDAAFRNLVSLGLSLPEAARRTSTIAADHLGLSDRGRIALGLRADLVVLDGDLRVADVLVAGRSLS